MHDSVAELCKICMHVGLTTCVRVQHNVHAICIAEGCHTCSVCLQKPPLELQSTALMALCVCMWAIVYDPEPSHFMRDTLNISQ